MEKLDYWLVYQTPKCKWRVFADPVGALLLFSTQELATETGLELMEKKLATTFAVLDVRRSYHFGSTLNQAALPDSETWGL